MACYRGGLGGIVLSVRLTPRAGRDAIDGIGMLSDGREVAIVRVRAVPEDGAANRALVALLATAFGLPKSAVSIVSGGKARLKQAKIEGDPLKLAGVIDAWPRTA